MDPRTTIIDLLRHRPYTVKELSDTLGMYRYDINTILNSDSIFISDSSIPPQWSLTTTVHNQPTDQIDTVVMIDLGNTHDCLKQLEPYAQCDNIIVIGFCDYAYAGYPSCAKSLPKNVYIHRSMSPKKNAADISLVWTCCSLANRINSGISFISDTDIISRLSTSITFLIATKDQGFLYLQDLVVERGHRLIFCRNWKDIKMHL